jgi:hypothetical protein
MLPGRLSLQVAAALGVVLLYGAPVVGQTPPARNNFRDSLPATDFSLNRSATGNLPRPAPGFALAGLVIGQS